MKLFLYVGLLGIGLLAVSGCGGDSKTNTGPREFSNADTLHEVAGMLRNHMAAKSAGPSKVADLAPFEIEYPRGFAAVKSGAVVVIWGAKVAGEGGTGAQGMIVAHMKDVPTNGGEVVLDNGDVKTLTAEEFKAAPKAAAKK
jgi:hypothetical protein